MARKASAASKTKKLQALSKRRLGLEERMHKLERDERAAIDAIEWKAHQAAAKKRSAFNKRKDSLRKQYDKLVNQIDKLRL